MNSIKILIAAVLIMLASNVLAGCTPGTVSQVGIDRISAVQEMKKTVELSLERVESEKDIALRLVLNNPERKPLTSAQAWLSYNPETLEGVSIDTTESDFEMAAPYDNDFDSVSGLLMLGRSNPNPVSKEKVTLATLHFKRVGEGAGMIEAYDYRQGLEGHVSANMMLDGTPINILLKPSVPLFTVESDQK